MTRFRGIDDLGDITGRLGRAFDSATLGALYKAFSAAATDKAEAAQVLEHFREAALTLRLRSSESAFNKRAQRVGNSIMNHMPDRTQFAAMRDFHVAKEALFDISPKVARRIAAVFAHGAGSAAPQQPRSPAPQ